MSPTNLGASVRDRLLKLAKARGDEFQLVLTRYALERLLVRVSRSAHAQTFVLKGAMLFTIWAEGSRRPTKDIDLLGTGTPDLERIARIFRDICDTPVDADGVLFMRDTIEVSRMKEDEEYEGVRVHLEARIDTTKNRLQVDIGFGDAVTPAAVEAEVPTLLPMQQAPKLRVYPRETVVAEKLQAMTALGIGNSRMKDFYDIWFLMQHFDFDGPLLTAAVQATFSRRKTPLPAGLPLALTTTFASDAQKKTQWKAFVTRTKVLGSEVSLDDVVSQLAEFLGPVLAGASDPASFNRAWKARGPWSPSAGR